MTKAFLDTGQCPACGSRSIHEPFCEVNWADMARLYRETQDKIRESEEARERLDRAREG